jgi:PleD family two-component response regulator
MTAVAAIIAGLLLLTCLLAVRLRQVGARNRLLRKQLADQAEPADAALDRIAGEEQLALEWRRSVSRYKRRAEPFAVVVLEVRSASAPEAPMTAAHIAHSGRVLAATERGEDMFFRLDDRTYAVQLVSTDHAGAVRFIDRARGRLSSLPVRLPEGPSYLVMVAGASEWRPEMKTLGDILEPAARELEIERGVIARQRGWSAAHQVA